MSVTPPFRLLFQLLPICWMIMASAGVAAPAATPVAAPVAAPVPAPAATPVPASAATPTAVPVVDGSYILRPNDAIRLDVYEEPDLSVSVRILKTGQASFPLIGAVQVGGVSVTAAAEKIRLLYAKDYLVDPKLTLSVLEYATEYISVIGAVRSPGQIPMPVSGNLDLASAIATTGGLTELADPSRILLVRASGASSSISMGDITSGTAGRTKLDPGDRIIVNQSSFVGKSLTILGQVGRQGPVPFPVSGRLDLVQAIAMAGGLTDLANPKKIALNRKGSVTLLDYKQISERGDRPYLLEPGDIITIPERLF